MTTLGRILAVEDDEAMRMFLEEELRDAGYDVVTATNGIAALHLFNPSTIDVVVSDVIMPGMSGNEMSHVLLKKHPGMPVLYMSGYTDHAIVHNGILNEGIAYLQKPLTPAALYRKVSEVLQS